MVLYPIASDHSETVSYPNPSVPIKAWTAYSGDFPTGSYINHWHSEFEFAYITRGTMFENINGAVFELKEGDLLFVNSLTMHFGFWREQTDCEFLCLVVNPTLIESPAAYADNEKLTKRDTCSHMIFRAGDRDNEDLFQAFLNLHRKAAGGKMGYSFMESLYHLFATLGEKVLDIHKVSSAEKRQTEIMHRMIGFIQGNYNLKITLDDISDSGMISRSKCGNLFNNYLAKSPMEYLNEYRIYRAMDFLRDTNYSVSDISKMCGFSGASYFTERFTELIGITPTDFRIRNNPHPTTKKKP